jgi:hypothetical protein
MQIDDVLVFLAAGVTSSPPEGSDPPGSYERSHPPRPVSIPPRYCITFGETFKGDARYVPIRDAEDYLHETEDEEGAVRMLERAGIERRIIDAIFVRRLEIDKARATNDVAAFQIAAWREACWRVEVAKATAKSLRDKRGVEFPS